MLKVYDPKAVSMVFAGILIGGYSDGTFVKIAANNDSFALLVGADGDATRSKTNDRSGRITFTLQQSSLSNDLLSAAHAADVLTSNGDGIGPLLIKDNSGRTLVTAEKAWIVKQPDADFAREVSMREWIIETDNLVAFLGGN